MIVTISAISASVQIRIIALLLCFYFAPPPAWHARAAASWKGHGVKTGVYGVKTGV
jgi:hypothetical protein